MISSQPQFHVVPVWISGRSCFSNVIYGIRAPLKNAMVEGSRPPNVWGGKAAGIVSVGGARGQFHLRQIGIFIDLHFLNKLEFFLNAFQPPPKLNPLNGDLIDEDAKLILKQMLLSLKAFTFQLHHNN